MTKEVAVSSSKRQHPSSYKRKTNRVYKTKTGRPSDYRPEMCDDLIEYMSQGYSLTQWCAKNNMYTEKAQDWMVSYPQFGVAYKIAREKCEEVWEEKVKNSMNDRTVNFGVLKMYMGHRFKWAEHTNVTSQNQNMNLNVNVDADIDNVRALSEMIKVGEY